MEQKERPGNIFYILCPLCLSSGRNLYFLNQNLSHLTHVLNIFSKSTQTKAKQMVCWECYANLKKISRLQSIALHAERKLQEILEKPGEGLNNNSFSRLTTVKQTKIITVISKDMEEEIEELLPSSPSLSLSPPYLPSSPSLPSSPPCVSSPPHLPPLPHLHPSPSLNVKWKRGDAPKFKTPLKPVYILVEKPKTAEKTSSLNHAKFDFTLRKLNNEKNKQIEADQLFLGNKKMLNTICQSSDRNPKALHSLGKMNNVYDKRKMSPTMEINSKETIVISDSESDDICDNDTPLNLSYDNTSDIGNEILRYDSEHEGEIDLTLLLNDNLKDGFDSLATIDKTSNLDTEQQTSNEESLANYLNNDTQERTISNIILDNNVQEVPKQNIISEITRKSDDVDGHTVENITKQKNYNKITSHKAKSLAKVDINNKVLRNNLDMTPEETQKQKIYSKNTINNSSFCTADNVDEENISFVQIKDVSSDENYLNSDHTILRNDNNIKGANSNCDYNNTLADIQACVGNNTDNDILSILNNNENNTGTITLPQIQLMHDKTNPDQQINKKNEKQIETVDHETIINEKLQKYSENDCQTLLQSVKAKQQLIVNKITADMPWNHAVFNKHTPKILKSSKAMKPNVQKTPSRELTNENKQYINLETLKSLEIIMTDHWYAKRPSLRLNQLRQNILKAVKKTTSGYSTESVTQDKTPPLILRRETTIKNTEINDLCANEVLNDHSLTASTTNYCENEHVNSNTMKDLTRETRNVTTDDMPMSSVNMSVSIDLREFFPESIVYDKNLMSNNINIEYGSAVENENFDYSHVQCGMDQEEIHLKPEPISSEIDYYVKNDKPDFNYYDDVQKDGAAPSFDDHHYETLLSNENSSNIIDNDIQMKTDHEKDSLNADSLTKSPTDLEINSLAHLIKKNLTVKNPHLSLTIESTEEKINNITTVWRGYINDDSGHLETTEDNLLKPLHFTDWVDETYSHVTKNNKRKSHISMSKEVTSTKMYNNKHRTRARRQKTKGERKSLKRRNSCETQNKNNSNNKDKLLRKRIIRDSDDIKETSMQEKINKLCPIVETEANYNTGQKIIKNDCPDIIEANMQEKINDNKLSLHATVEYEANYNLNLKLTEKNNHDIKAANMQEKINDNKLSHYPTTEFEATAESEANYDLNNKIMKKDSHDIKAANLQEVMNDSKLSLTVFDYSLGQCGMDQEKIHIKPEPIDSDELTDSASEVDYYLKNKPYFNYNDDVPIENDDATPSFDDQYYETLVSNENSSNLSDKNIQKKTNNETDGLNADSFTKLHTDSEINSLAHLSIKNLTVKIPHLSSTIESTEEQINNITTVLKKYNIPEELKDTVNNWLGCINDDSEHLKTTEDDLLKPLHFTDWVDETYSHVAKINKHRTRVRRQKAKGKGKRKSLEQRKSYETQNKNNSDNEDKLLRKRIKRYSDDIKEATMQEKINELCPTVKTQANYISSQKIMEKDCQDIKEAKKQENINDNNHITKSEANYNSNKKYINNDSHDTEEDSQEKINNNQLTLYSTAAFEATGELDANCNPNKKRTKKDSRDIKDTKILETIKDYKLALNPTVETKANYNLNKKSTKRHSNNIKDANIIVESDITNNQNERINVRKRKSESQKIKKDNAFTSQYSLGLILESEENNNPNQPNSKNDTNLSTVDKIAPTDFFSNNHGITLNELKGLSDNEIFSNTDSKEIKEPSNEMNKVTKDKCNERKTATLLPKKMKRDSEEYIIPEINISKLLLYPVVELEKNEYLDRHNKNRSEAKKLNEKKAIDLETNESYENKIIPTDFIENNKVITLDELEGDISDDELVFDNDDNKIEKQYA